MYKSQNLAKVGQTWIQTELTPFNVQLQEYFHMILARTFNGGVRMTEKLLGYQTLVPQRENNLVGKHCNDAKMFVLDLTSHTQRAHHV